MDQLRRDSLLEKLAKPRWVKEFLGLGEASQKRILKAKLKEREIQNLGTGAERVADLVVNPKHGLSVRKVPHLRDSTPAFRKATEARGREQVKMEKDLRSVARGKGDFTHIRGDKGNVRHYDYSPASRKEKRTAGFLRKHFKAYRKEEGTLDRLERSAAKRYAARRPTSAEAKKAKSDYWKQYDKAKRPRKKAELILADQMKPPKMTMETRGIVSRLGKKHPGITDIRKGNTSGGKIIDLSHNDKYVVPNEAKPTRIPSHQYSKRVYLGKKK